MWPFGPKRLGYALGSGSARGLAHVGVLKALAAEGIEPDVVTGTSMGAIVGALYAAGHTPGDLERIALGLDTKALFSLVDVTIRSGALLSGEKIEEFLRQYLPESFEELRLPFGCVSTDLATGERVVHTAGGLIRAVRASASLPLVFMPVRTGEHVLVDGFLTDPVPVSLARNLGATVVVAVDVSGDGRVRADADAEGDGGLLKGFRAALKGEGPHNHRGLSSRDVATATVEVLERHVALPALKAADVVISPDVHEFAGYQYLAVTRLLELGERAGHDAAATVRKRARLV